MKRRTGLLMKTFVALALAALIMGSFSIPIKAQGVTAGFVVHVGFVYPYLAMYNMQVTVNDQSGRVLGSGISPDGSELIVGVRTENPTYALTVRVEGYASFGYYPYPYWAIFYPITSANPFWKIGGINTFAVQLTGGDYWTTVIMSKS